MKMRDIINIVENTDTKYAKEAIAFADQYL